MSDNKIQIYTGKDRLNFVLHLTANAGMLLVTMAVDRSTPGLEIAAITAVTTLLAPQIFRLDTADYHPSDPEAIGRGDVLRLQQAANKMAARLNIRAPEVSVSNFSCDVSEGLSPREDPISKTIEMPVSLVSTSTAEVQEAGLAHEIGHLAANHLMTNTAVRAIGYAALAHALFSVASTVITGRGILSSINAFEIANIAFLAQMLIGKSYSRANEYQADRIGKALTGAKSMISFLKEISKNNDQNLESWKYKLVATHPSIENRVRRLNAIRPTLTGREKSPSQKPGVT